MLKRNDLRMGLILGFIAPVISFFGYYFYKFYPTFSFGEFATELTMNKPLITAITIPCLLLNIILFTIYINSRRDQTAKGIFVVTLLYAITSLIIKFTA
ncbi:MAG: hypothetical protein EOO01_21815 [Chitinophagaceae bacterium]|nr:MAG: hypothetical protein EOO01_21815 [Chitinophagaceae bacterium]